MNQVVQKELLDFQSGRSQIQIVLKAIQAREKCILMIRDTDKAEKDKMLQTEAESKGETKGLYLPP